MVIQLFQYGTKAALDNEKVCVCMLCIFIFFFSLLSFKSESYFLT